MIRFVADMAINPFLLSGLVAGLLASVACGVVGPYVVTRRIVFLSGAIAHIALGGIGASIYAAHRWPETFSRLGPLGGAVLAAIAAAVVLAWLSHRAKERIDTAIGALWSVGMAAGILLIKLTPGYHTELMSYLFGNLAFVSWADVRLIAALNAAVLLTALLYHKRFLALSLDEEQAELQGVDVLRTDAVLLVLVALTVITLTQVVGLILVIALLSLPAAAAARRATRLSGVIALSVLLCAVLTTVPRVMVYGTRLSPESAIVLAAGAIYLLAVVTARFRRSPKQRTG